jgi:hypothetical protein
MKTILTETFRSYEQTEGEVKLYHLGKLWLVLDKGKVIKDNPGWDTPAMVYHVDSKGYITESSTYWCALGEGSLADAYELSDCQQAWLEKLEPKVNSFLYGD